MVIYLENKKGKIYSKSRLKDILNLPILTELSIKQKNNWEESLKFILKVIRKKDSENILIFPLSKNNDINQFEQIIAKLFKEKIKVSNNSDDLIWAENIILLSVMGETTIKDIKEFNNKIYLLDKNTLGLLIVE